MVMASTSVTVKQNAGQKVLKNPLYGITIWTSKDKDPKNVTENTVDSNTNINLETTSKLSKLL